jgi:hypothetical protein
MDSREKQRAQAHNARLIAAQGGHEMGASAGTGLGADLLDDESCDLRVGVVSVCSPTVC